MKSDKASISQRFTRSLESGTRKFLDATGLGNSHLHVAIAGAGALLKKAVRHTALDQLDICVAEHCNLGCYSCNHFSQLAAPEFAGLDATERDLKRLSELSGGNIPIIYLCGGEPLLNPELHEFMRVSRQYFPKSRVQIITNGLLLLAQKDIFWESVKKYNVVMTPTKYPGINWEKIEERARESGYEFEYFGFTESSEKISRKFRLDLSGSQDPKKSFKRCCMAGCTVAVQNGRVATCAFVFNMRHFNKYFNKNVPVTDSDSIDIYKARTMREIVDFVNRPVPLCRYCASMGEEIVGGWKKSENKIEEWT